MAASNAGARNPACIDATPCGAGSSSALRMERTAGLPFLVLRPGEAGPHPLERSMSNTRVVLAAAILMGLSNPVALTAGEAAPTTLAQAQRMPDGAMMQDMQSMNQRMSQLMRTTGNPDRDFAQMMIPHHQGAIEMAKVLLERGKDPELRNLAEKIIKDQQREIAQLQDWLKHHQ